MEAPDGLWKHVPDGAGFLGIRRRPPTRARAAAKAPLLVAGGVGACALSHMC